MLELGKLGVFLYFLKKYMSEENTRHVNLKSLLVRIREYIVHDNWMVKSEARCKNDGARTNTCISIGNRDLAVER